MRAITETGYDVAVIGGGPAGATAAAEFAAAGYRTLLLDREGRIKPCGGAIPPRLLADFNVPLSQLTARVGGARIFAPSNASVDMAIADGFVGMVDRDRFDPWLRERAARSGAVVAPGRYESGVRLDDGSLAITIRRAGADRSETIRCGLLIGADGANSSVRRDFFGPDRRPPYVFAYHEIVRSPTTASKRFDPTRCDVFYQGHISPDFYGWVFPHGETTSVGVGSAVKGFDLKAATRALREASGLSDVETIRCEGAPLPLKPLRRWDDGRNVLLAGDAAGIVAPASGEGIYYAMLGGRLAGECGAEFLRTGDARMLGQARKRFMKAHGRVFMVLEFMQGFWYRNDKRRERFVAICGDKDVQRLTWESYLNKRFARTDPMAYARVFLKDLGHVIRMAVQ